MLFVLLQGRETFSLKAQFDALNFLGGKEIRAILEYSTVSSLSSQVSFKSDDVDNINVL